MVLESVFADVMQQLLHLRNFDHSSAAKRVQRVIREPAFSNVAAHLPCSIVGGKASKAHLLWLDQANNRAVSVLFPDGAGDDFLEIQFERTQEVRGNIR